MRKRILPMTCSGLLLLSVLLAASCYRTGLAVNGQQASILLGECSRDWLKYRISLLPQPRDHRSTASGRTVALNIRIINIMDNVSPLRKRCTSLEDYNRYYEYLLNSCKNEIYLQGKNSVAYPVSFSFENNYDAFPFESINVGYRLSGPKKNYRLVYIDRVFAQDTVYLPINL